MSKFRAVNKVRFKLKPELLNKIDKVMLDNFIPLKSRLLDTMITVSKQQAERIAQLEEENKSLCEDIRKLEKTIQSLRTENEKTKSQNIAG